MTHYVITKEKLEELILMASEHHPKLAEELKFILEDEATQGMYKVEVYV